MFRWWELGGDHTDVNVMSAVMPLFGSVTPADCMKRHTRADLCWCCLVQCEQTKGLYQEVKNGIGTSLQVIKVFLF